MPWWWVIPAALGGYYLYKELAEEGEPGQGPPPPLSPQEQRAILPAPDGTKPADAPPPKFPALPEWARHIDPIGLGQFLRRHGPRFLPTSWSNQLARSTVPTLRAEAKNYPLDIANLLFVPVIAVLIVVLWILGKTGKDLLWILAWSGLIGYGTNWIAIKMLFHPREKRPLLRWQGVVPSRRQEILVRVTDGVCENLISEEIIRKYIETSGFIESLTREHREHFRQIMLDPEFRKDFQDLVLGFVARILQSPEFRDEVLTVIERRIEDWAGRDFTGRMASLLKGWWRPQLRSELERLLETLPTAIELIREHANKLLDEFPRWIERGGSDLEDILTGAFVGILERLDIRSVIYHQLSLVGEDRMEEWVVDTSSKELTVITLLGGVLGLAGGFVIYDPTWGVYTAVGTAALLGADQLLVWLGAKRRPKDPPPS